MTRTEAEQRIYEHMVAIKGIYNEYAPDEKHLALTIVDNLIQFNNRGAYDLECNYPMNVWRYTDETT